MLLYHHPHFLDHDTGRHPENAERLRAVEEHLPKSGLLERCARPEWTVASPEQIGRIHAPEYLREVEQFAEGGGGYLEGDTVVRPESPHVAKFAAGAVCDAVRRVVGGEDKQALCLVRPPGHHALDREAMGFCLLNNIAVAARLATADLEVDRVLIVDWDVHHGNGTQAAFWEDERVGFFSIHRFPFYPGSGDWDEKGGGAGLGATRNVPIKFGTPRREYLNQFKLELERFVAKAFPDLILISAGFDSHAEDPIGSLGLETEDFAALTEIVLDVADQYAEGRVVSVLEGGYHPQRLAESVETHLRTMLNRP